MASKPKSNIAELRRRLGMTQLELSRRVGVTETTIANWEKNRGGGLELIERFINLCEALRCSPRDLLSYDSASEPFYGQDTSLKSIHQELGVSEPVHFSKTDEVSTTRSVNRAES